MPIFENNFAHQALKRYFESFNILSTDEITNFSQMANYQTFEKFDYLIRAGEISKQVAFIVKGIFRSYYISEKGEEFTYCFTFANELITAYSSLITGQSTIENIQAISPVELLVVSKAKIDNLSKGSLNWAIFFKMLAEQQYIGLEKRIFQLQRDNATQRYMELIKSQPEYIQNIPLQYLASYLGITQRHLSRIRNSI